MSAMEKPLPRYGSLSVRVPRVFSQQRRKDSLRVPHVSPWRHGIWNPKLASAGAPYKPRPWRLVWEENLHIQCACVIASVAEDDATGEAARGAEAVGAAGEDCSTGCAAACGWGDACGSSCA